MGKGLTKIWRILFWVLLSLSIAETALAGNSADVLHSIQQLQLAPIPQPAEPAWNDKIAENLGIAWQSGSVIKNKIETTIKNSIDTNSDIKQYFANPAQEFGPSFYAALDAKMAGNLTLESGKAAILFAGHTLLGNVSQKILTNGRAGIAISNDSWVKAAKNKLLSSFDQCISNAKSITASGSCLAAAPQTFPSNLGKAMTDLIFWQEFAPKSDPSSKKKDELAMASVYQSCANRVGAQLSGNQVQACTLAAVRAGILPVEDSTLKNTLKTNLAASGESNLLTPIYNQVKRDPAFAKCVTRVNNRADINKCSDALTLLAGGITVEAVVMDMPKVRAAVSNDAEISQLAATARTVFTQCGNQQVAKNARDSSGTLLLDSCQNRVQNNLTKTIIQEQFSKSISSYLKPNDPAASRILRKTITALNSCWSDGMNVRQRQACGKTAIETLALGVSSAQLAQSLPKELMNKSGFASGLLDIFKSCLDQGFPADFENTSQLNSSLTYCQFVLTQNSIKKASAVELTDTIHQNVPKVFALKSNDPQRRQLEIFQASMLISLNSCIDGTVTLQSCSRDWDSCTTTLPEACIKAAGKSTANTLAGIEFDEQTLTLYRGNLAIQKKLKLQVLTSYEKCIDQYAADSLAQYQKDLVSCGQLANVNGTSLVGGDQIDLQVDAQVKKQLSGTTASPAVFEKITSIKTLLKQDFKNCISQGKADAACEQNILIEATGKIGVVIGEDKVSQYYGGTLPAAVAPIDASFRACLNQKPRGDINVFLSSCTHPYEISLAESVGDQQLQSQIQGVLQDKVAVMKGQIDQTSQKFHSCMDALLIEKSDDIFNKGVTLCQNQLSSQGLAIVENYATQTLGRTSDADAQQAESDLVSFLPCLQSLMPSSPASGGGAGGGVNDLSSGLSLSMIMELVKEDVSYDPATASKDLQSLLASLKSDVQTASPGHASKQTIYNFLKNKSFLDQVVKSMALQSATTSLQNLPVDEKLPDALLKQLLTKGTLDQIFTGPDWQKIKDSILNQMIKPTLLDNKTITQTEMDALTRHTTNDVESLMIHSPLFGKVLVDSSVQSNLDKQSSITKLMVHWFSPKHTLDWSKISLTPKGQVAENYIRDQIVLAQATAPLSDEEMKKRLATAQDLVKKAII